MSRGSKSNKWSSLALELYYIYDKLNQRVRDWKLDGDNIYIFTWRKQLWTQSLLEAVPHFRIHTGSASPLSSWKTSTFTLNLKLQRKNFNGQFIEYEAISVWCFLLMFNWIKQNYNQPYLYKFYSNWDFSMYIFLIWKWNGLV